MNKKIITNTLCLSLLIGCVANTNTDTSIPIDEQVLQANSIAYTLDIYDTRYDLNIESRLLSEKVDEKNSSIDIRALDCFIRNSSSYNSDECILFRRNTEERQYSVVKFFDYKRFLPENSSIKTDDDFLRLVKKYEKYKNKLEDCYKINEDNSLTSTERQEKYTQCLSDNNIEELLKSYISEGLEKEKTKIKSIISDCEQAEKKAKEAKKKAESYRQQFYSLEDLNEYKVVDFATEGVMLQKYYDSPRYFVYTTDKNYANGAYFRGGEYYYKISNNVYKYTTVTGGTNQISVFVPTKYKIKDVEKNIEGMETQTNYHLYLKNKNILDCDGRYAGHYNAIKYKDEKGEEHWIDREEEEEINLY